MINVTPGALDQFSMGNQYAPAPSGPVINVTPQVLPSQTPLTQEGPDNVTINKGMGPITTLLLGAVAVAAASYLVPKAIEYAPRLWRGDEYNDGWEGEGDTVDFEVEDAP